MDNIRNNKKYQLVFASSFALIILLSFIFAQFVYAAESTTTQSVIPTIESLTSGAGNSCATIDHNWKRYGQTILGANEKVSDVVLNACQALGGIGLCHFNSGCRYRKDRYGRPADAFAAQQKARGCTPNGGAPHSQHLVNKAIDLSVPKGREAEFLTLAICGLRRVNKCQGGAGLYSSGAVHIDVREGRRDIWSDNYGADSIKKLTDTTGKKVLYDFAGGNCTPSSIATSYEETNIYGAPMQYTPPKGLFAPIGGVPNPFIGSGGQSAGYTKPFSINDNTFTSPTDSILGPLFNPSITDTGTSSYTDINTVTDFPTNTSSYVPADATSSDQTVLPLNRDANPIKKCDGLGLLGKLFGKCGNTTTKTHIASTHNDLTSMSNDIRNPSSADSSTKGQSSHTFYWVNQVKNTVGFTKINRGGSRDVFYAFHTPIDTQTYTPNTYNDSGVFVRGEAKQVDTRSNSDITKAIARTTLNVATNGARYGAYFGLIQGVSPLIIGGAPRTFIRLGEYLAR